MTQEDRPSASRRALLAGLGTGVAGSLAAGRTAAADTAGSAIAATPIATGFTSPLDVAAPPGTPGRYLVVDQRGVVERVDDGTVADEPFLDIRDRTVDVRGGYSEMGLLGLALHPNYASNRRVYVRYSAPRRAGTPSTYSHTFVLAEFQAGPDGERVDPATERPLLEIPEPQPNHNAGAITFGPDGYLYIGVGDGGGANDTGPGHTADWYGETAGGNGQDVTTNLLGSVLRIDVDGQDGDRPYAIPDGNPLVGHEGFDEHYAWGLRNPWRMSVDGDDLWVADVGQNRREEVNRVVNGGNYGWNVREGSTCFSPATPDQIPDSCPTTGPGRGGGPEPLRDPTIEYSHAADETPRGVATVGGHRYRGSALADLDGQFVFADWAARGRLFVARPATEGQWPIRVVPMVGGGLGSYVLALGRDRDDELLVCSTHRSGVTGSTGALHKLTGRTTAPTTAERSTTDTTTTSGAGGPGLGTLAGLAGVGGLTAWALARARDRTS